MLIRLNTLVSIMSDSDDENSVVVTGAFVKFSKIRNSADAGHIRKILEEEPRGTVYCYQEKCHGANFNIGKKMFDTEKDLSTTS